MQFNFYPESEEMFLTSLNLHHNLQSILIAIWIVNVLKEIKIRRFIVIALIAVKGMML